MPLFWYTMAKRLGNTDLVVCGLTRPTMHPPTNKRNYVFLIVFYVFLILDMLTLNKLLRTIGFEPLYLVYRQKLFYDFRGGKKNTNGNIFILKYQKYTSDHSKC